MMRVGFLPSDFNPMILMLGEAADCQALAKVLRQFAQDSQDVAFTSLDFCQIVGPDVLLTAALGPPGVQRCQDHAFIWRVSPEQAMDFARRLEDLAHPGRQAGSEDLDCDNQDCITVKVSRGEYTEDFLTDLESRASSHPASQHPKP